MWASKARLLRNGGPFRSKHMAQIAAVLSNQRPIFTPPRRPEGHGKIEVFNYECDQEPAGARDSGRMLESRLERADGAARSRR